MAPAPSLAAAWRTGRTGRTNVTGRGAHTRQPVAMTLVSAPFAMRTAGEAAVLTEIDPTACNDLPCIG